MGLGVTLVDSDDDEDGPATNVPSGALAPTVKTKSQEGICIVLSSDEEDVQPQPKRARYYQSFELSLMASFNR